MVQQEPVEATATGQQESGGAVVVQQEPVEAATAVQQESGGAVVVQQEPVEPRRWYSTGMGLSVSLPSSRRYRVRVSSDFISLQSSSLALE